MIQDVERLQKLHAELQRISARLLNEKLSEPEREKCRRETVKLANEISAIAQKGDAPVYIINLNRRRFLCNRSWGSYWIGGRRADQPYESTVIAPVMVSRQAGPGWKAKNNPLEARYYTSREVAEDLCREINGDLPAIQVSGPFSNINETEGPRIRKTLGVFVSESQIPEQKQLNGETAALEAYYSMLVDEARAIYAKTRDRKLLATLHFEAAEALGIDDEEWCMNYAAQQSCRGCGKRINARAAICPLCGWVLDEAAWKAQKEMRARVGA